MTSSPSCGVTPNRCAFVILPPPPPQQLTALRKRTARSYFFWTKPWPCTSARPHRSDRKRRSPIRPSPVGPPQLSLDVPTPRQDKQVPPFTQWWSYRSFRRSCSVLGRAMASFVVLECHLWLNLMEIKDTDKAAFLDSPVSPTSLFGPAVDRFTEHFTAAQKTLQAVRCSCPSAPVLELLPVAKRMC